MRGLHKKATVGALDPIDADPLVQRRSERRSERLDVGHDVVLQHEAVRIVAGVRVGGHPALPVGRHQAERVPAVLAPRAREAVALEHDVGHAQLVQAIAHGQTRLATTDDDHASVSAQRLRCRICCLRSVAAQVLHGDGGPVGGVDAECSLLDLRELLRGR